MRLFFLCFILFLSNFAFAQKSTTRDSVSIKKSHQSLIIVNGKIAHDDFLKVIDPETIESIEILKDSAFLLLDCRRCNYGTIVVKLKKKTKLLSYEKLLEKFKVRKEYRQYITYLDNQEIGNINDFCASLSKIKDIRLQYRNNGTSEIPYLNIVTNP